MQRYIAPMPDRPVQARRAAKAPHGGHGAFTNRNRLPLGVHQE
jgi:hypothetical protein